MPAGLFSQHPFRATAFGSMSKRILVYGFGPYGAFRDNITAGILQGLPRHAGLTKHVFPVRFNRRQFVEALRHAKPDIVLGLGQSSRRQIEIESRGVNHRRDYRSAKRRAIFATEPKQLATTFKIKAGRWARVSRNAGDYVCNYSIYILLREIKQHKLAVRLGFIHIPHDYDRTKARALIRKVLRQCETEKTRSYAVRKKHSAGQQDPSRVGR